jgi:hypothetical protein
MDDATVRRDAQRNVRNADGEAAVSRPRQPWRCASSIVRLCHDPVVEQGGAGMRQVGLVALPVIGADVAVLHPAASTSSGASSSLRKHGLLYGFLLLIVSDFMSSSPI